MSANIYILILMCSQFILRAWCSPDTKKLTSVDESEVIIKWIAAFYVAVVAVYFFIRLLFFVVVEIIQKLKTELDKFS